MVLYVDCAFLDDITNVAQTEEAIEKFSQDWQQMKKM